MMDFIVKSGLPEKQRSACIVVGIFQSRKLTAVAERIDAASDGHLSNILRRGDMEGAISQSLLLYNVPGTLADRILLIGCGKERELDDNAYRKIIQQTVTRLKNTSVTEAVCYLSELNIKGRDMHWKVRQAVEVTADMTYQFDQLKSTKTKNKRSLRKFILTVPSRRDLTKAEKATLEGSAIATGVDLAKTLGNLPGNICTPSYLADQAKSMAKKNRAMKVEILEEADMKKLGMGALLSVSQGSRQAAKLITLDYRGGAKTAKPIVLVGKGITFDSGGISLKPGGKMDEMKYDMCGAAAVMGAMAAVSMLNLPVNVVAIVPASENLPDGLASKPGDIVTSMSGQTIEILNTDAEGRLVLCDALSYAEKFDPAVVIDVATLTGAVIVALGRHANGLLSNHPPLVNDLNNASKITGDRVWELPLWDEYQDQLKSNFADMANIGGREGGTITAACFLSRFTKKYHWAHLDIAGTAWKSGEAKGATGRPVPLLVQYILGRSGKKKS